MPRPGPTRPQVAFRLADEKIARLDQLADAAGVDRSDVLRDAVDQHLARAARAARKAAK